MVRLVFLAIFSLGLFSNCNSPTPTNDQPPKEPEGYALARMIWPVEIRVDRYPALGDTIELEARFRFIRENDPKHNAKRLRHVLDSVYAKHGALYVSGKFRFFPYLNFYKSSKALKYISGDSAFFAKMALSDSGNFRAKFKAIQADTVMTEALLYVFDSTPTPERGALGGGFKHECFIIQENNGIGLGDCWEKH